MNELSPWIEWPVAALLVVSGVCTLAAGIGMLRFRSFFMRMHPPALVFSLAAWCVTLASVLYFSAVQQGLALHAWLIIVFLAISVPVTTSLLARTELFRRRTGGPAGPEVPPPLRGAVAPADTDATRARPARQASDAGTGARP